MRVYIHSGHLSVDNGARFPLTVYCELARLLDVRPDTGSGYGDDSLDIAETDWPIAESLLKEQRMLYRVTGVHEEWQNVLNNTVRRTLRMPLEPEAAEPCH